MKGRSFPPFVFAFVAVLAVLKVNGLPDSCSCSVKYIKKGCYNDPGSYGKHHLRPLKQLLINDRDKVDWYEKWNNYLHNLTCKCAKLVKQNGYRYFGLQFYGECWSGNHSSDLLNYALSKDCWGYKPEYMTCDDNSMTECIGQGHDNYVYEITSEAPPTTVLPSTETTTQIPETTTIKIPETTAIRTIPKPVTPRVKGCDSNPCQHGGDCLNFGSTYFCDCPNDFAGVNCERPLY